LFGGTSTARAAATSKRRVAMLLQEALAGHTHGEHQSSLIDRVVRLSETSVRAVMVPFHRVVGVSRDIDRRELMRVARLAPFTRFLVFAGRRSQVIGVVKVDEILRSPTLTVADAMHPVTKLSANTTVAAAIAELRHGGSELAVVVNHAGHMLGLATLRDLLEEVVGEFGDNA